MTDSPKKPDSPSQSPVELHWGISYLREDIQDLKYDIRGIHDRIDETNKRIDETNKHIDETAQSLRTEIHTEIRGVNDRIDAVGKRQDTHFRWLMTTMIGMAGAIIAILKI